jgi:hypothetical protein
MRVQFSLTSLEALLIANPLIISIIVVTSLALYLSQICYNHCVNEVFFFLF